MKQKPISLKILDNLSKNKVSPLKIADVSLKILYDLESIVKLTLNVFEEHSLTGSKEFASFLNTLKDLEKGNLESIGKSMCLIWILKQKICKHPKKDRDICDGVKCCMNCNLTL